jgi:hypothetical protein
MRTPHWLAFVSLLPIAVAPVACDDPSSSGSSSGGAFDAGAFDGGGTGDGGGHDGGDGGVVIDCPKPTGGPTEHSSSVGTETWTADKSPHVLPYDTSITGTLTLEPCAEVLLGDKKTVTVGAGGALVAEGIVTKPIHIGARDLTKPFAQIRALNGGTLRFAHATIDGGGDPLNTNGDLTGTIYAQGADQALPTQGTVFVDHVTIAGSKSNGLTLVNGAGFAPGSQELQVTGAAQFPMSIWSRAIGTVPSGKYTGNAVDEIVMPGSGGASAMQEDGTMKDWGVPYRVGDSLSFGILLVERQGSPGVATLTIEAGVKVRVKKGGHIQVQRFSGTTPAQGALVVNGTAAKPVVFTSAEATPAAGDWLGVWFGLLPAANDKMDYARIEYAGGLSSSGSEACNSPGTNDAAIRIFGVPAGAFVTNTTIVNSAGHGIDRGWRDDAKTDFLATNTFTTVAGCRQSYPRDTNGSCPTVVPCP